MNEKCGSKQTNFERTLLCNEKFTILNLESNLSFKNETDRNKNSFENESLKGHSGEFSDMLIKIILYF